MASQTNAWSQMSAMHAANFASAMGRLPGAITPVVSTVQTAGSRFQSFFSSIGSGVSTFAGHIGSMASSVVSGFASMGSSVIGAIEGFGRFVFFARIAAQSAMGFAQALLGQNANMEQSRVALSGLLGSGQAADAMLRTLWNFAATTPFEFPQLVQSTQELIGMGFAARDVIPVLTAVGDAAAGVGRGKEGVDRITLALGQMQARGKVTGQDMLQLTEAGIPAWKILAQAMGLTVEQVQNLSQQGKLGADSVTALWHGMERMYGGQMAGQAKTFNGLLSTLHDNAIMALMTFSGPLFNMAKSSLSQLTTLAGSPAFSAFAKTLGQEVAQGIAAIVAWVKQAVQWFGQFAPQVAQVGAAFNNLAVALAPTAARMQQAGTAGNLLAGALGALRLIIVGILGGVALLVNGIASVIQWFNAGSPAVQRLYTMFQQLGSMIATAFIPVWKELQASWSEIVAALQPIMPQLRMLGIALGVTLVAAIMIVISVIGGLVVAFAGVLVGIVRIVTGIITVISGMVQTVTGIINLFADLFSGRFDKLAGDLERIMMGIATMFGGVMLIISGIFQVGWSIIIGFATGFVNTLIALFNGLYQTLVGGSIIPDMCNGIVSAFIGMISSVLSLVSSFISSAISLFVSLGANATMAVINAANQIISAFNSMRSQAIATVQSMVSGIGSALSGLASIAWNAGVSAANGIANGIRAGIGAAIGAAQSLASAVANFLPKSPAKEGPLRDLNLFGPAIPRSVAAGIMSGTPLVRAAVGMMVQPIQGQVTGQVNANAASTIAKAGTGGGSSSSTDRRPLVIQVGNREFHAFVDYLGSEIGSKIILQRGGLR